MDKVTVVVINYNGGSVVVDTIESIQNQEGVRVRIIVVDDGSTDKSPRAIREKFPDVEVYREEENTRDVNRLRNEGLERAETDKVFLTDNDVILDESCIKELKRVTDSDEKIGICIPRLMYLNERSRLYHEGGYVHYLGTAVAPNRDVYVGNVPANPRIAVGGGIALLDMEKLEMIGGFDEDYELAWGDDGELHQRMLLAGYKCVSVPTAVGFHEFEPFGQTRYYRARGQISNRWRFILSHYSAKTLLLITPMLICYEIVQAFYYLLKGIPLLYLGGSLDAIQQLPDILERRKEIQALRTVPDRDLLTTGPIYVRPSGGIKGKMVSGAVKAISLLFSAYWFLIRPLLSRDGSVRQGYASRPGPVETHSS